MATDDNLSRVKDLPTKHSKRLHNYLLARVENAADIPDIIQEVFIRLLRAPQHHTIRAPLAYMLTIARHIAMQHGRHSSSSHVELDTEASMLIAVAEADPALAVDADQCLDVLDRALSQLPPKIQAAFLLSRRDGLSMDQVAERLGITRATAKKYLALALCHFRKQLKGAE